MKTHQFVITVPAEDDYAPISKAQARREILNVCKDNGPWFGARGVKVRPLTTRAATLLAELKGK